MHYSEQPGNMPFGAGRYGGVGEARDVLNPSQESGTYILGLGGYQQGAYYEIIAGTHGKKKMKKKIITSIGICCNQ